MLKRIMAWVLLIGFLFLILNLIVLRYYWQQSMIIYLVIVFAFLLTNRKTRNGDGSVGYTDASAGEGKRDENSDNTENKE